MFLIRNKRAKLGRCDSQKCFWNIDVKVFDNVLQNAKHRANDAHHPPLHSPASPGRESSSPARSTSSTMSTINLLGSIIALAKVEAFKNLIISLKDSSKNELTRYWLEPKQSPSEGLKLNGSMYFQKFWAWWLWPASQVSVKKVGWGLLQQPPNPGWVSSSKNILHHNTALPTLLKYLVGCLFLEEKNKNLP